ncbi:MAG: hypothetical protein ACXWI6_06800 [Burkholderiales bacterium]
MKKSFVRPNPGAQTLSGLPPSSREEIRRRARPAGLHLPDKLMEELCDSYPAFEAMVRRLPRARPRFDEPAHTADVARLASLKNPDQSG